jgi:hypothetical protein
MINVDQGSRNACPAGARTRPKDVPHLPRRDGDGTRYAGFFGSYSGLMHSGVFNVPHELRFAKVGPADADDYVIA